MTARRKAIVAAVAAVLVVLILRTAAVLAIGEARPELALRVASGNPVALIGASGYYASAPKPPSPDQLAQLRRAALADPLYPEPFLAAAAQEASAGHGEQAIRLAQAARARDPRWLPVHGLLLQQYAQRGDLNAAVATMTPLAALSDQSGAAVAQSLEAIAGDPRGAKVIAAAMRTNPHWRAYFVRQAHGPAGSLAFQTLAAPPAGVGEADQRQDRTSFLLQLIQARDYQRAYLAWVNFLPTAQAANVAAIYDGDFAGLPGLEPFNWSLTNNEAASAQRRADSALPGRTALDISFFGNEAATIATETLLLQPGTYRFDAVGEADGGGNFAGTLQWRLVCLPSGAAQPLASVKQFSGKPFALHVPVTVPAQGCGAQQISLSGDPGEVATLIHAQFTGLRMMAR